MDDKDFKRWMELRDVQYTRISKLKFELDSDNPAWKPFYLIWKEKSMSYTWSFSSLKEYINCPRQYNEVKNLKNFEKGTSQQMLYGSEVHKALEDYTLAGTELAKNYQRFKPMIDSLLAIPGTKYPEYEMALNRDKQPCDFHDENRWVRGIVDLLIVDGDHAFIVDYKTGSAKYPDAKQLKLMALMTFAYFPEVKHINAGLMFVMHDVFITESYKREDIDKLWGAFLPSLERLRLSYENNAWNENPTPLCGWCPVTTCKFHKER
jgi:CRISPR/Cas system-associated exonuclease Cas4 (RecB family)